jgi:hypothetical protein
VGHAAKYRRRPGRCLHGANGATIEKAINSVVPEAWRPIASLAVGVLCYLVVNGAAKSDAKKLGNG